MNRRARREVEWASAPGLYDDPIVGVSTGGTYPSSRLASTTLTQLSR